MELSPIIHVILDGQPFVQGINPSVPVNLIVDELCSHFQVLSPSQMSMFISGESETLNSRSLPEIQSIYDPVEDICFTFHSFSSLFLSFLIIILHSCTTYSQTQHTCLHGKLDSHFLAVGKLSQTCHAITGSSNTPHCNRSGQRRLCAEHIFLYFFNVQHVFSRLFHSKSKLNSINSSIYQHRNMTIKIGVCIHLRCR